MLNNLNALERTVADFETLAAAAGFKIQQVFVTRSSSGSMYRYSHRDLEY